MDLKSALSNAGVEGIDLKVTVTKVFPVGKEIPSQYGEGTVHFQNIEIKDDTATCKCTLSDREVLGSNAEGQVYLIKSKETPSHGKKGVKVVSGKYGPEIKVTPSANMDLASHTEPIEGLPELKARLATPTPPKDPLLPGGAVEPTPETPPEQVPFPVPSDTPEEKEMKQVIKESSLKQLDTILDFLREKRIELMES